MAAVLRVVHPSELLNCSCKRPTPPFIWLPAEEKPRCHECLKPVQDYSRLLKTDRAAARWKTFYLGILDIMAWDYSLWLWEEGFAVGSQTVTTRRGETLLDL